MKIQCDACEGAAATVVCCADEAALCARCDVEIHAANKLASKHQRLPLEALSAKLPRCDVCQMRYTHDVRRKQANLASRSQEKAAFIFCVEDRALFCQDCDEPIHVPGTLSGNHQRYLATGIRVGLASASACSDACDAHDSDHHAPPKATIEPPHAAVSAAVQQLHKEPTLGFKELEWFADIDLFHEQAPKASRTLAEVPELFGYQAANDAAYYRPAKAAGGGGAGVRQSKKARIEVTDDEDYLIVPDLG
ncbi:B-box zinc finger protein 24 [Zea mays]|uniref:B-box zinc finger protein 24 n=1 Tax=Zea mays TaxID=4577 RepID=A0A3L6EHI5_MAIZE|nr:B-box zinc finger protein 24 [Zea mays]